MTDTTEEAPRLNRRQLAKIRTAKRVKDAATALFAEVGYEAATIRDIAKRAGMSTGAVFANYVDKAELYRAIHGHLPITAEQGLELARALRGFTRNRGDLALAPHAHEGCKGAMEALFDLSEDLVGSTIGNEPEEVQP